MPGKQVRGWQAISRYTGATREEIREAIEAGELRLMPPRVKTRHLDCWMRLRRLRRQIANERIQLVPDPVPPFGGARVAVRGFPQGGEMVGGVCAADSP